MPPLPRARARSPPLARTRPLLTTPPLPLPRSEAALPIVYFAASSAPQLARIAPVLAPREGGVDVLACGSDVGPTVGLACRFGGETMATAQAAAGASAGHCTELPAAVCSDNAAEPCFYDPSCDGGGVGCYAGGVQRCRFCGFANHVRCPGAIVPASFVDDHCVRCVAPRTLYNGSVDVLVSIARTAAGLMTAVSPCLRTAPPSALSGPAEGSRRSYALP